MVIKKALFLILVVFVLGACTQQHSKENETAREVVWNYIEAEGNADIYNKEMWDEAEVEETEIEDKYKAYIENANAEEEIFLVSINDQNVVASPTFIVDQDIEEVIGVIPGE